MTVSAIKREESFAFNLLDGSSSYHKKIGQLLVTGMLQLLQRNVTSHCYTNNRQKAPMKLEISIQY